MLQRAGKTPADFAVDKASFALAPDQAAYTEIKRELADAAKEWETACLECKIKFVEVDKPAPVEGDVFFIVKYIGDQGGLLAQAFFPGDAVSERYVYVAKSYYTSSGYDKVGVLRHELGHILGYRHEQIRPETPVQCGFDKEDSSWVRIPGVSYDAESVMHYPCEMGGVLAAGSYSFALSDKDKAGHRKQYLERCAP